jgi:hypothetical protein
MRRFEMNINISRLYHQPNWAILLIITVMLMSSSCALFPSPPPPPPPEPQNQSPVIYSVTAEKEALASTESQVTCEATDPDGDILSYWWSADGGTIKGQSSNVTWTAPDIAGAYTIKVTVTDGKGGQATGSAIITVTSKPNHPPTIVRLTRDGIQQNGKNRLRIWRTTTIECVAEDPDGDKLNFIWSATGGKIQGEGNKVGWTAPGVAGDYTVTVIVDDGRGGKATDSMKFEVYCCGGG